MPLTVTTLEREFIFDMRRPRETAVSNMLEWEEGFFNSRFHSSQRHGQADGPSWRVHRAVDRAGRQAPVPRSISIAGEADVAAICGRGGIRI
jgi:hypothetical protein